MQYVDSSTTTVHYNKRLDASHRYLIYNICQTLKTGTHVEPSRASHARYMISSVRLSGEMI